MNKNLILIRLISFKRLILTLVGFCCLLNCFAQNNSEIIKEFYDLIINNKLEEAFDYYKLNDRKIKDNPASQYMFTNLFSFLLFKMELYDEALELAETCSQLTDIYYDSFIPLHNEDVFLPYYLRASLSYILNKDNYIYSFEKVKKAYDDADLTNTTKYQEICQILADYYYPTSITQFSLIINQLNQMIELNKFDEANQLLTQLREIKDEIPYKLNILEGGYWYLAGLLKNYSNDLQSSKQYLEKAEFYLKNIEAKEYDKLKAQIKISLAHTYIFLKDYKKADEILQSVLTLYFDVINNTFIEANVYGLLGGVNYYLKNYKDARTYIDKSIKLFEKIGDINKSFLVTNLGGSAVLYKDQAEPILALKELDKAFSIMEGNEVLHSIKSQIYFIKGYLTGLNGNLVEASQYLEIAKEYSINSPNQNDIDLILAAIKTYIKDKNAKEFIIDGSNNYINDILTKFIFLSENQRNSYFDWSYLDVYNSLLMEVSENTPEDRITILEHFLFGKKLLLRMNLLTNNDRVLNSIKEKVADKIIWDFEKLKKALYINFDDIKEFMSKDDCAIEFMIFNTLNIKFPVYYACIFDKQTKYPEFIYLFNEGELNDLIEIPESIADIYNPIKRNEAYYQYLYSNNEIKSPYIKQPIFGVGNKLNELIWSKIADKLKNYTNIYFSTNGKLNSISLSSLLNNFTLSDKNINLIQLSSLVTLIDQKQNSSDPKNITIYGGIDYDNSNVESSKDSSVYTPKVQVHTYDVSQRSGMEFLEGTLIEAEKISELMNEKHIENTLLTHSMATEGSFKCMDKNSPEIIHLATHGYFIKDDFANEKEMFFKLMDKLSFQKNITLWKTGLLMAGSNKIWTNSIEYDNIEDGILTSEEISTLDLNNTELVVLSACETGLGDETDGEGIMGLQRAFKLAGVKTIIMSLWKVPDSETSLLMQNFYKNWLNGMDKHKAFLKAQNQIKESNPNPYYWAGFIILD